MVYDYRFIVLILDGNPEIGAPVKFDLFFFSLQVRKVIELPSY